MRWLIAFLFLFTVVQAEEITTGNLITNGNLETSNDNFILVYKEAKDMAIEKRWSKFLEAISMKEES